MSVVHELTAGKMAEVVLDAAAQATRTVNLCFEIVAREDTIILAGLKDHKPVDGIVTDTWCCGTTVQGAIGGQVREAVELINSGQIPTAEVARCGVFARRDRNCSCDAGSQSTWPDAVRVGLKMT